mmetsp:Transcript_81529/g.227074  ORF Transcript_81529/g.227074 Transcript_81529/m.227074 type:complete len:375 (+) Transcript_81529:151-1275(+)
MRSCHTFQPQLNTFAASGRSATLFYLSGVLPITYERTTYNIPMTIYFDPPYPKSAPRCFVTPTAGMEPTPGHQNVDRTGLVYVPYLSGWNMHTSALPELLATLASVFSQAPPVWSSGSPAPAAAPAASAAYPALSESRAPIVAATVVSARAADPKEAAVRAVTEKVKACWSVVVKPIVEETNQQLKKCAELEEQVKQVDAEMEKLKAAEERNRKHEADLRDMEDEMRAFIDANDAAELDPDRLRDDLDPDSQQVLSCLSEELALEEFLVALDELLAGQKIGIDDFMREVRDTSRRQFMCKVQRKKAMDAVAAANGVPVQGDTSSVAAAPAAASPVPSAPAPSAPAMPAPVMVPAAPAPLQAAPALVRQRQAMLA